MKRIDLLPPEQRVKASRERGLLWAILILVAIVVALGLVYVWQNGQVTDKQVELDGLTAEMSAVQQQALALRPYADPDHAHGHDAGRQGHLRLPRAVVDDPPGGQPGHPVSYTHLRAHETRHDLVCRLLLE